MNMKIYKVRLTQAMSSLKHHHGFSRINHGFVIFLLFSFLVISGSILSLASQEDDNSETESISRQEKEKQQKVTLPPGRWKKTQTRDKTRDKNTATEEQLMTLGYLEASQPAPDATNVTIYDKDVAYNGLNFITSGHTTGAYLTDMKGKELYSWNFPYDQIIANPPLPEERSKKAQFWRRAHLFENGDVLAIFDSLAIIKINKKSNLIWVNKNNAHHDLDIAENGDIYLLTKKEKEKLLNKNLLHFEDFITILSPHGKVKKNVSVIDCLLNSAYKSLLIDKVRNVSDKLYNREAWRTKPVYDVLHTNSIKVFDGRLAKYSPVFEKGNILTSFWSIHTVAIIDPDQEKVVWALTGLWNFQHDPTFLSPERLLVFNNNIFEKKSSVYEINPWSQKIEWFYNGTEQIPFFSVSCSTAARLPNGNTLITESDNGRAFEVTPKQEIVWEYYNPNRISNDDYTLISTLFEVVRLDADFPLDWLED